MADLRVVTGAQEPALSGDEVLREVSALIEERLPLIPLDDPYRASLYAFALAGGIRVGGDR